MTWSRLNEVTSLHAFEIDLESGFYLTEWVVRHVAVSCSYKETAPVDPIEILDETLGASLPSSLY
jgi:hypothetical protein